MVEPSDRMLAIDELLRTNVDVSEKPPDNVDLSLTTAATVGRSAALTMAVSVVLWVVPWFPDVLNGIGAMSFLLGPILVGGVVGHRRLRRLPRELRPLARKAIDRDITGIRPIRWKWIGGWLLLLLVGVPVLVIAISSLARIANTVL